MLLIDSGKEISKVPTAIICSDSTDYLFGVIANTPSAFNPLSTLDPTNGRAIIAEMDLESLPDQSRGLMALDALVISGVDTGTLSSPQRQALSRWVANGGRLIVTGGPDWQKTAAGLGDLLPLTPTGSVTLDHIRALQGYAASNAMLAGSAVVAIGTLADRAAILASQDEYPLLLSKSFGLGKTYYLAADPAIGPLYKWAGMALLYQQIFSIPMDVPGWAFGFREWSMARDAMKSLPGLSLPSVITFCSFLCLYVLVLGPLNFLLMTKLKRRNLTWVSIPILVLFFTILAFLIGNVSRGNRPIINQLAVVQVWPNSTEARVDGLVGVYSPQRTAYKIEIGQSFLAHPIPYSTGSGDFEVIEQGNQITLPELRVEAGGVSGVAVEGYAPAPNFSNSLKIVVGTSDVTLEGDITNNTDFTLEDAVVLAPGSAQSLGDFRPGETRHINLGLLKSQRIGQVSPFTPSTPYYSSTYTPYYYGSSSTTLSDILGTSAYYTDKDIYRRYTFLGSVLGVYGEGYDRGGGVTLAGWAEQTPLDVSLVNRRFEKAETTLYLITFNPELDLQGSTLKLSPGLFTWMMLDSTTGGSATPYDMYINPNTSYTLQFNLSRPISYTSVSDLSLRVRSSGATGPTLLLAFSLWDYIEEDWVEIPAMRWGVNPIVDPARFVAPGGVIRLKIENTSSNYFTIDMSDFTLSVQR